MAYSLQQKGLISPLPQPCRLQSPIDFVPGNILLEILKHLPNGVLYGLSLLCRRLHYVALPLYLSRFGIQNPTSFINLVAKTSGLDALSGLRITLFLSSSAHIACEIPHPTIENSFHSLARFKRLVLRLSNVGQVTIRFRKGMYNLGFSNDQSQREKWERMFRDFCEALAIRGCHKLTLVNLDTEDRMVFTPTKIQTTSKTQRIWKAIGSAINIGRGVRRQIRNKLGTHPKLSVMKTSREQITLLMTSIEIRSPAIFDSSRLQRGLPVFLSLRSLTIGRAWETDWAGILTQVARSAPMLSNVTLSTFYMDPIDVISFVGKLPHLTHLKIHPGVETLDKVFTHRFPVTPNFPSLTSLSSSPRYINTFLSFASAMPKIQSIEMCLTNLAELNSDSTFDLIARIIKKLADSRANVSPSLKVYGGGNRAVKRCMIRNLETSLGTNLGHELAFVKILTIENFPNIISSSDTGLRLVVFPRWLSLFRELQHIIFTGVVSDSPETLARIVRTSHSQCSTMTVNNQIYSIRPQADMNIVAPITSPGFLDLPDDVLYIIFEDLKVELLALATLCRRLRLLTIPVYLTLRGIPNPASHTSLVLGRNPHRTFADISALQLSSSLSTIKHLHCSIMGYDGLFLVFEYFQRLCSLILSLRSIEKVSIEFSTLSDHRTVAENIRERWGKTFGSFLDAVVQRHCVSLKLTGGALFGDDFSMSRRTLDALRLPEDSTRLGLTSLDTDLDTLLQTPVLPSIISVLRHSEIAQLDLHFLSSTASQLLPSIGHLLPALTKLDIGGSCVLPSDVIVFVNSLPQLKHLRMRNSLSQSYPTSSFYPKSNPTLGLTSLSAPTNFLTSFLNSPTTLPKLQTLTVILLSAHFPVRVLSKIAEERGKCDYPFTVALAVPLSCMSAFDHGVDAFRAEDCKRGHPSDIITGLELFREPQDLPPSFPSRWLSLFPNLLHLTIKDDLPDDLLASACKSFTAGCPSLETLYINGINQLSQY